MFMVMQVKQVIKGDLFLGMFYFHFSYCPFIYTFVILFLSLLGPDMKNKSSSCLDIRLKQRVEQVLVDLLFDPTLKGFS